MQAGKGLFGLPDQSVGLLHAEITEPAGEMDEILRLGERSSRDVQEVKIVVVTLPR